MNAATLQPAAGAHGELTGHPDDPRLPPCRAATPRGSRSSSPTRHTARTRRPRPWPASRPSRSRPTRMARSTSTRSRAAARPAHRGGDAHQSVDARPLRDAVSSSVLDAVHAAGALAYMDGANMNAILGKFKPGQAGFDVMHFNTHKTFSTPHGGWRPGRRSSRRQRRSSNRSCRGRGSSAKAKAPTPHIASSGAAERPYVNRPRALVPGQRRCPRARLRVHACARRRGPRAGQRRRRARRQLPAPPTRQTRSTCRTSRSCKHEFVASAKQPQECEPACACWTSQSA